MNKNLFAAKGIYSNWDRLGNISAAVNHLQQIKKQVAKSMKTGYQGTTHKAADVHELVLRIADKALELQLQKHVKNCDGQAAVKPVPDLRASGRQKFSSSSLATFNKKMKDLIGGKVPAAESDTLPVPDFSIPESREPDDER